MSLLTNWCLETGVVLEECRSIIVVDSEAKRRVTDKIIGITDAFIGIVPVVEMVFTFVKRGGLSKGTRSIIDAFIQEQTLMTDVSSAVGDRLEGHRSRLAIKSRHHAPVDENDVDRGADSRPTVSRVVL